METVGAPLPSPEIYFTRSRLLTVHPSDSDPGLLFIATKSLTQAQSEPEVPEPVLSSNDERLISQFLSQLALALGKLWGIFDTFFQSVLTGLNSSCPQW